MSVTGIALILFLTFHMSMNVVALFSEAGYNMICHFLGANWYAVVATMGLAGLAMLHIVYAFILTAQNRRARGSERYAVVDKPKKVEWASQNMLVLGIIILLGLLLHLFNFWYKHDVCRKLLVLNLLILHQMVSHTLETHSQIQFTLCCMLFGLWQSGCTFLMDSGVQCTP